MRMDKLQTNDDIKIEWKNENGFTIVGTEN
jgi:hypothetical protein